MKIDDTDERFSRGVFYLFKDREETNIERLYERKKNPISKVETSNHTLFNRVPRGILTRSD